MNKFLTCLIVNHKEEDGQSTLEFAIVLPILLLIVCGIIEFGLFLNMHLNISNCTREGVRYAAIHSDQTDIEAQIKNRLKEFSLSDDSQVTVVYSKTARRTGDVTVTVSTKYNSITPLGKLLLWGDADTVSSTLTMKVE